MTQVETDTPRSGPLRHRLDGWKDIASHIGRGVRTAQRWEKELGLPVRRQGTGAAEAIYAYTDEIDDWRDRHTRLLQGNGNGNGNGNGHTEGDASPAAADTGPQAGESTAAGSSRRGSRRRIVWAVVLCVGLLGIGFSLWRAFVPLATQASSMDPVSVTAVGRTLKALGPDGSVLWETTMDVPLDAPDVAEIRRHGTAVGDLDGDGRHDVVIAGNKTDHGGVYAWNHAGRPRFQHHFTRHVTFGEYACPPARATNVQFETAPRFPGTVWAWGHHPLYFPAVLQRLDARGRVQSEYWSNGYIDSVKSLVLRGRPVTFVGAVNNDQRGASLAVFYGDVNGSAPSANPAYQCRGCPAGAPDAFLVFPRSRLQAVIGVEAQVSDVTLVGPDRIVVHVRLANRQNTTVGDVTGYYTLDADLSVVDVELSPNTDAVHQYYETQKLTTAATRYRNEHLFPVKRWNGTGWDLIPAPAKGGSGRF